MPDNTVDLKIRFKTDTEELEKLKKKIKELGSIDLTSDQSKELKAREKRAKTNMKNAANRGDEKSYNTYHNEVLQLQKQLLASVTVKNKDLIDTYIKAADKLSQQEKALNKAQARLNKQQKLFYSDSNDLFVSKMNWGYGGKNAPKDKKSQRMIAGVAGLRATLSNSSSVDEVINQANNLISNDPSLKGKDFISSKSAKSIKSQLKGGTTEAQIKEVVDILLEKMIAHAKKSFASKEIAPATADLKSAQEGFSLEKKIFNTIEQQIFPGSKTKEIIKNIDTQTSTNKKRNITLSNQKLDDEVKKDLNKVKNNAKAEENFVKASKKTESFGKKLFKTFSFGAILRQLRQLGQVAIQTITQLDQALTTQAMVSGRTRQETYALLGSYQSLAKQCGATSTEVAQVATAYLRQGKTASEAVKLTETAVKAAKVAGIDTATSVDYLTTAINGFQMSAEQSMEVSDKFAALAASAAVSYDELATALSKVAAQANLAGLSMDYTMALLTKGIETTRESAESIGTALKTVLARMREVSDYGETLDGSLSINNVEQQLSYVGIQLKDTNGELKSTEVVLNELGNK